MKRALGGERTRRWSVGTALAFHSALFLSGCVALYRDEVFIPTVKVAPAGIGVRDAGAPREYDYDIDLETGDVRIKVGAHISRRMRALGFVLPIIPTNRVMMEHEWVRVILTISSKQQQLQLDSNRITLRDSGGGELSPESTSFDNISGATGGSSGCDFEEHDRIAIVRVERTCYLLLIYARRPRDIEEFDLQIEGMSAGGTPVPSLILKMTKRSFPYSELGP